MYYYYYYYYSQNEVKSERLDQQFVWTFLTSYQNAFSRHLDTMRNVLAGLGNLWIRSCISTLYMELIRD